MILQNINYENMILIYHISRYIMLPRFTSYRKSEICFKYLRIISRMNAASNFYFQYICPETNIIKVYCIVHGSLILNMCFQSVWWTMRAIQFNYKSLYSFRFNVYHLHQHLFKSPYTPLIRACGFQMITSHFTGKCRRNSFHFNISLIELI